MMYLLPAPAAAQLSANSFSFSSDYVLFMCGEEQQAVQKDVALGCSLRAAKAKVICRFHS